MESQRRRSQVVIALAFLAFAAVDGLETVHPWEYDNGKVHNWGGHCKSGKAQSPVKIDSSTARLEDGFEPFIFKGYDELGHPMEILNNGKTIKFEIDPEKPVSVEGGGLPGKEFKFVQGHFHWGSALEEGSEHILDERQYPMEMHLVHFNMEHGEHITNAVHKGAYDGLAVLGVMFDLQAKNNTDLQPFFEAVAKVEMHHQVASIPKVFPLENFLPRNTDMFFRYNGSLTTPSCAEVVVWTIFKQPVLISESQMNVIRNMKKIVSDEETKPISGNYRPSMLLNNRTVLDVDTSRKFFNEVDVDDDARVSSATSMTTLGYLMSPLVLLALRSLF